MIRRSLTALAALTLTSGVGAAVAQSALATSPIGHVAPSSVWEDGTVEFRLGTPLCVRGALCDDNVRTVTVVKRVPIVRTVTAVRTVSVPAPTVYVAGPTVTVTASPVCDPSRSYPDGSYCDGQGGGFASCIGKDGVQHDMVPDADMKTVCAS